MCSNSNMEEINDSKQIKTSPVKTSPIIEERKIPEDELSLIIDTVNKIQTFLGEQKETLKKINTLSKKELKEIALKSHVILMEEFRTDPLSFIENIQKRNNIMKSNPDTIKEYIGQSLYKKTISGLNIINYILNSFAD